MEVDFELDRVSVAYETSEGIKLVLDDLHLQIARGDWVAVVGRNGSGKSTLARVLAGLSPLSRGKCLCTLLVANRWSVQMIFQNPDAQIVGETLYEDVCFGLENKALAPAAMPSTVEKALAGVGLAGQEQRLVEHLSGGQKQLLCIADALAMEAHVFLFDESTSMLDPLSKQRILAVAQQLHQQGHTIIWVTQLMEELGYARRILALEAGQIVFDGTPLAFFYGNAAAQSEPVPCTALGFVLPYAVQVAHHLLQAGLDLPRYPVLPEEMKELVNVLCQ